MFIEKENMQVVFVNTTQRPKSIEKLKLFTYSKDHDGKPIFKELCKVFYPHPEAPEDAIIFVFEFLQVSFPHGFDTTAIQCIDAMKGLSEVKV